MDTDDELSQEPWFERERLRAVGLACPRERCQALLCQRARDVLLYSMELGELRFQAATSAGAGVWLRLCGEELWIFALLLRGGYAETSLPRPGGASPTYCVFLDCAAVEAALQGGEGTPARVIDWKMDVLRRNDKLARRCWTCGFKCGRTECNYRECARCGMRGHVRGACRAGFNADGHIARGDRRPSAWR